MARAGLTPDIVREGAVKLVRTDGPSGLTLATLARALGVRTPSLYNHVSGLEELTAHAATEATAALADALEQHDSLEELAAAYLEFARAEPGLYRAGLRAPDPGRPAQVAAAERALAATTRCLAEFPLTESALIDATRGLRALLHGFVELTLAGAFGMPRAVDSSLASVIAVFRAGLLARPATDPDAH